MGAIEKRTEGQVAQRTPLQQVITDVRSDGFKQQIANALPGNVTPDRFVRCAVTAIMQSPELVGADRNSLFQSIVRAAQDGLLPDGREAALVIYKVRGEEKVQYIPMVGGLRKIAAKHGFSLVADVVRNGDHFEWSRIPPRLEHRPAFGEGRGEIMYAYAVAFDREWRFVAAPVVMDVSEIEKVRAVSRTAKSEYGPWVNWYDRMCCKTVARRLFKELPLGDLDEQAARVLDAHDDEHEIEPSRDPDETAAHEPLIGLQPPADDGPDDTLPADETEQERNGNGVEDVEGEVIDETGQVSFADKAAQAQERRRRREAGEQ